jgi:hypothetical protein
MNPTRQHVALLFRIIVITCLASANQAGQTLYVAMGSAANGPGTSWENAFHTLAAAAQAAQDGDTILVTNGTYAAGTQATPGNSLLNRLVITNQITVRSVHGAAVTQIVGSGPSGAGAVRCVYMSQGILDGFTLTNGCTNPSGSGSADRNGGGAYAWGGVLTNCQILGCSAVLGGGVYGGTLHASTVAGNSSTSSGGGTYLAALNHCVIRDNRAEGSGGGTAGSSLVACLLSGNTSGANGGGAYAGTLLHCTLSQNRAALYGGGVVDCTLDNSIIYDNSARAAANYYNSTVNYSCTTPAADGTSNITTPPLLITPGHLSPQSPCVGQGNPAYRPAQDLDGDAYAVAPAMGCDEPATDSATGPLQVTILAPVTTAATGANVPLSAQITGLCTSNRWSINGETTDNALSIAPFWASAGSYTVELRAFNASAPEGIAATVTVQVIAAETSACYVWPDSPAPAWPYQTWSNAAHTIQEGVGAQELFGGWVWVTNGVYQSGARATPGYGLSNRLVLTREVTVKSVNGAAETHIVGTGPAGNQAVRCVYMERGILDGFTLRDGFTRTSGDQEYDRSGGGVYGAGGVLRNCILRNNSAAAHGGGAYLGTLQQCVVIDNTASSSGGGTYFSTLTSCTLSSNRAAAYGGGAYLGSAQNSILYYNTAGIGGSNYSTMASMDYCCTTPAAEGNANLTAAPQFLSATNLHLRYGSPCIDQGADSSTTDLDGHLRPVDGDSDQVATVDIGAYEYDPNSDNSAGDTIPDGWKQRHGFNPLATLPTNQDSDGDGSPDLQEWQADTNPTNAASFFRITDVTLTGDMTIYFDSSAARTYTLQSSDCLLTCLWTPVAGQTSIPGTGGRQGLANTTPTSNRYHRVVVQFP